MSSEQRSVKAPWACLRCGSHARRGDRLADPNLQALAEALGDDDFAVQLLYFASEPAFATLARAAMEASPERRAWLAKNAARLMAAAVPSASGNPPSLRLVEDD